MDIQAWLKEQLISADAYDADTLLSSFLEEMEDGLGRGDAPLAMIPAYVGIKGDLPVGKTAAVIDAGGTNLRTCIAKFNDAGEIEITGFSKQPMPGRDREVSPAEFFSVLADALEPLRDDFDSIGFCFSYAAEILPDFDGRLLYWTKEIKIPQLVGERIGAGLLQALNDRKIHGKKIIMLNDTVAALLAGRAQGEAFNASSYIGFILGTGTNTAYVEQNKNIGKLVGNHAAGSQVINVESGAFSGFERGPADLSLDERSEHPGVHVFEKTISGAYLGALTLELLQTLAAEGALSDGGGAALAAMKDLSTIHIDNLAMANGRDTGVLGSDAFTDGDRDIMKTVFNAVVDRASFLAAVNIAAAVVKCGCGHEEEQPVCINIDGSTYYKTWQMKDKVQEYLKSILDDRGLHVRCIHVDDAPVTGAAIAGLTAFQGR